LGPGIWFQVPHLSRVMSKNASQSDWVVPASSAVHYSEHRLSKKIATGTSNWHQSGLESKARSRIVLRNLSFISPRLLTGNKVKYNIKNVAAHCLLSFSRQRLAPGAVLLLEQAEELVGSIVNILKAPPR